MILSLAAILRSEVWLLMIFPCLLWENYILSLPLPTADAASTADAAATAPLRDGDGNDDDDYDYDGEYAALQTRNSSRKTSDPCQNRKRAPTAD